MSSDRSDGPLGAFFEAERRFHRAMPVADLYSKLLFRTILWFLFFTTAYVTLTALI
ncbi:hypothetical protein [Natrarchaeobaculum sulfurireducens]|uniref:Uncharacterized protein n=1 Tax=Natrarchaeobaculum sulfurireducens TaxID=2044521 RepID=A0A346PLH8_9EURY|nr:hypothetical protein [Natrarchaeobaculum sulfurireducens]AXR76702.1 hypothetical protein AArc1_0358 [Natrarchaeobaculum sulfurireducens]AXR80373.1 hypothetical protein AArcMg_0350 [Natrarchaeobaculum sulfurireducens]